MPRLYQTRTNVQLKTLSKYISLGGRSVSTNTGIIQAGDRVLLQSKGRDPFLSKVLRLDGSTSTQYGEIMHANIIGRKTRDAVKSSRGSELRVFLPTLAEYVTMTPRNVTPVYPADANLIISLLDLHVSPPGTVTGETPSLEILEAGTGHGALTLYLARAIHGANKPHLFEKTATVSEGLLTNKTQDKPNEEQLQGIEDESVPKLSTPYEYQNDQRQAVIHTIDVSPKHRKDARAIVKGFRQGTYYNDVEFHVGDVSEWIDRQVIDRGLKSEDCAFLSHILLDMPSADKHVEKSASVLHVDGSFLAFNPSITQIIAIVEIVKRRYLPLQLDRIVELGASMTGGREWDIRAVKPRRLTGTCADQGSLKRVGETEVNGTGDDLVENDLSGTTGVEIGHEEGDHAKGQERGWEMICRPKVGDRIAGGGFLGVWKKMKR